VMFRKVFTRLTANLFDRLKSSPRRVPVVGMTATLPLDLQGQFGDMSGVKFDFEERGAVDLPVRAHNPPLLLLVLRVAPSYPRSWRLRQPTRDPVLSYII